jgi:predicted GNAT family N-acyltransferase
VSADVTKNNMNGYTLRLANWQNDSGALRAIRETVFIYEQGVPPELEWDEADANCIHLLAMDSVGKPIGTARLSRDGSVGRMAVLKDWRGKGVGSALVGCLLGEARSRQIKQIGLNAQTYAVGFYLKFGFQAVGEEFLDAGIPHVRMVLRLSTDMVE